MSTGFASGTETPREQLVENDTEGKDVGPRVRLAAENLLRRHVGGIPTWAELVSSW